LPKREFKIKGKLSLEHLSLTFDCYVDQSFPREKEIKGIHSNYGEAEIHGDSTEEITILKI
jgi:hypothetical protein